MVKKGADGAAGEGSTEGKIEASRLRLHKMEEMIQ
jgi:hypothetical protein